VRVVLAEDHALLRDGLTRLLQAYEFEVVEAVDNGPALLPALTKQHPDVAVVDVRLPPTFTDEGLQAAIAARRAIPGLPILVLSQHVEPLYARELLTEPGGGVGYLLKERVSNIGLLLDALQRVHAGETVVDPALGERVARLGNVQDLTPRELEVLALIAEGRSNRAIAQQLFVAPKTLERHISQIFLKLDLRDATDEHRRVAAVLAYLGHRS
jgi:DNA-binding NarL/FixJ family response regulator